MQQHSDSVIGVSVDQDRNRLGNTMSRGQLLILPMGGCDKLATMMIGEVIPSKHLVLKYSNKLQTGCLDMQEKVNLEPTSKASRENNLMLVNVVFSCNELCQFFAVKKRTRHNIPVLLPISRNDMNHDEGTTLGHHKFVQWINICATMNN